MLLLMVMLLFYVKPLLGERKNKSHVSEKNQTAFQPFCTSTGVKQQPTQSSTTKNNVNFKIE